MPTEPPTASVLTLGLSPWLRHADGVGVGGSSGVSGSSGGGGGVGSFGLSVISGESGGGGGGGASGSALGVVTSGDILGVSSGVGGASSGGVGSVVLEHPGAIPIMVGADVAVGVGSGTAGADADDGVLVPTKEAMERAARSRKENRQRVAQAEMDTRREDRELIGLSKRYLIIGMFGLPVVHFVLVWYFSNELRDSNANWYVKRNARMALLFGCLESMLFFAWVAVYQLRADELGSLSVLRSKLSLANLT